MHRRKPRVADAAKAHVLAEVRNRITQIKQEIEPVSTHDAEPRRKGLSIAVIMDEFTYECFRYEASLITFTPDNWMQVARENRPEVLFVESAWLGNDSSWRYQIVNVAEKPRSQLPALVQWYRYQGIPTVFWNKEDPAHYDEFLDAARLFDYVFTTDADCLEAYKRDLTHDRVFCLPFAVQPRIHNPIGSGQKIRDVAFAGSWYEGDTEYRRHRKEQMAAILTPALQHDVDIYDRHYRQSEQKFRFPDQYQRHIIGELPYDEIVYAYKMYRVFLNVNSVVDSPTMLPRRVLEILASGTCVLSGRSEAIATLVGSEIVPMSSSPSETASLLRELLEDSEAPMRLATRGIRKVMREHTCGERLDSVMKTIGISKNYVSRKKGVSIIACTNRPDYMKNMFANYNRQENVDRELIVVLNSNSLNPAVWEEEAQKYESARVLQVDEKEGLGTCLNLGIDKASFDFIAKFDDDDYYAPAYLQDLMTAFDYSGADIVGKYTYYVYFESDKAFALRFPDREFQYADRVAGPTIVARRHVFEKVRFMTAKAPGEDTLFLKECRAQGFRVFSADRFNFVQVRRVSKHMHTWKIADDEMLKTSRVVAFTDDYAEYVTC